MTTVDLARAQTTLQGFLRRRAQQLRAQGHGGCRSLGDLLRDWIASAGLRRQARQAGEVAEAFDAALDAVAPRLAGRIQFLSHRAGRLYLDCSSAAALAEFCGFHQPTLLADLRRRLPTIRIATIVTKPTGVRPSGAGSPYVKGASDEHWVQ